MPKRPRDTNPGTSASPKDEGSAVGSDATMRLNERENAIAVHDLAAGSGASSRSSSSSSASVRDELEDLSAPLSSLTSSSSDSDNSVDADDLKDRLLTHAKLTAATHVQPQDVADAAPSLADRLSNSTASKQAQQKSRALQKMRLELTRPVAEVSSSTALAVVDASGDSEQVLAKLVSSKAPKAAPAEAKKLRRLTYVDHRTIHYQNIRKDFYVVPPDMRGISAADMKQLLKELDGAKLHGNNPPRPLRSWDSAGLPDAVLSVLESKSYKQPFAVQSLGVPALMSGRDLLVSAKTGSGKTLGYLLPLIRHVVDQPACRKGEGPIGLVLVPTQELAAQVLALAMDLSAAAGLRCVASYGSTPLSTNISQVKAGCEVMIATPGRLLDLLTVNGGSAMALQRTSFVVVDEADRMFDSGFMEHVEAFLKNVRPDRQLALVSATMPRELRRIILRHLRDPLEISIGGGTSIPATNVEQVFHFFNAPEYDVDEAARGPEERFLRLLQIIGEESPNGDALVLIFTKRRDEVDDLIARLSVMGYNKRVATLYSGMDPIDREFALEHFSPGNQFILIATGVAERGLDIPFLDLVINYSLPNHYEGYVHRIGRTGRAGRPGKAVNFFVRGVDDDIAPEMVEGLERAGKQVPEELYERANKMRELRKDGTAHHSSGFFRGYLKGKVQHFADRETKQHLKDAAKAAGLADYLSSSSDAEEGSDSGHSDADIEPVVHNNGNTQSTALSVVRTAAQQSGALVLSVAQEDRVAKALAFAKKTTDVATGDEGDGHTDSIRFQSKYVINDLPNAVRGRLQSAKFLREICSEVEVSIVKKGIYFDARLKHSYRLKEGDEPLYLLIIGKTTEAVRAAKRKLDEAKEEAKERARQHGLQSSIGAQL